MPFKIIDKPQKKSPAMQFRIIDKPQDLSPDVTQPTSQNVGLLHDIGQSFTGFGTDIKAAAKGVSSGFYHQAENLFMVFDKAADKISKLTGTEKGGAFESVKNMAHKASIVTAPNQSEMRKGFVAAINRAVAGAALTIPEYMVVGALMGPTAGFAFLEALSEADKGTKATVTAAIKGGTMGEILKAADLLTLPQKIGTVGGVFGVSAAASGAPPEEIAASALTGAGLAALGGGGDVTFKGAVKERFAEVHNKRIQKDFAELNRLIENARKIEAESAITDVKIESKELPPKTQQTQGLTKEVIPPQEVTFAEKTQPPEKQKLKDKVRPALELDASESTTKPVKKKTRKTRKTKKKAKPVTVTETPPVDNLKAVEDYQNTQVSSAADRVAEISDFIENVPKTLKKIKAKDEEAAKFADKVFETYSIEYQQTNNHLDSIEKIASNISPEDYYLLADLNKRINKGEFAPKNRGTAQEQAAKLQELGIAERLPIVERALDLAVGDPQVMANIKKHDVNIWKGLKKIDKKVNLEFKKSKDVVDAIGKVAARLTEDEIAFLDNLTIDIAKIKDAVTDFELFGLTPKDRQRFAESLNKPVRKTGIPTKQKKQLTQKRKFDPEKHSITQFVRLEGGISSQREALKGEVRRFSIKEGFNLINNKTGKTFDQLRERAQEEGFLKEGDSINELIDLLEQDKNAIQSKTTQGRVFSKQKQNVDDLFTQAEEDYYRNYGGVTVDFLGTQGAYEKAVDEITAFLKKRGYLKTAGEYTDKDMKQFVINELLQTPRDLGRSHPEMKAIVDVQDERDVFRNQKQDELYQDTKDYWDLSQHERKRVGRALIKGDQARKVYDDGELASMGLDRSEINAYKSVRKTFDKIRDELVFQMHEVGIPKEEIDLFVKDRTGYFPHKRYGEWGVRVTVEGLKQPIQVQMVERKGLVSAKRRARLLKNEIENGLKDKEGVTVNVIKWNQIPDEYFNDLPSGKHFESIINEIRGLDINVAAAVERILQNQRMARGFGKQFIKRENIAGYSKDTDRVMGDYFNGYAGYVSKHQASIDMFKALAEINPQEQPNLYKAASNYVHYVLSNLSPEYQKLRTGLFYYYLGLNPKSALTNATQNWVTAMPLLSDYSGKSGSMQIIKASRDWARNKVTPTERTMLDLLWKEGVTKDLMTGELMGKKGNIFAEHVGNKASQAMRYMFGHVETYNRESTALAFFRAARAKGLDKESALSVAREGVKDSHFVYGKGNRPVVGRGRLAPLLTFRQFSINYVEFLKNRVKNRQYAAFAKSIGMLLAFSGMTGLPFWKTANSVYNWYTGEDTEIQTREAIQNSSKKLLGKDYAKTSQAIERAVTRGLPAAIFGIDMSGSVGMGDVLPAPTLEQWIGVLGDLPRRIYNVSRGIKSGQYLRAVEDLSPEFLRNPLSAVRLSFKGMYTRGGSPIRDENFGVVKFTPLQAGKKFIGLQPIEASERWKIHESITNKDKRIQKAKSVWLDALMVSLNNKDNDLFESLLNELQEVNKDKRIEDKILVHQQDIINRVMGKRTKTQDIRYKKKLEELFLK